MDQTDPTNPVPDPRDAASDPCLTSIRADAQLGALRRLARACQNPSGSDPLVILPGPRWVPEPHAEESLRLVLRADPSLDASVGWWRWHDAPTGPATVRVGGHAGDDLQLVDLLSRPTSVGPIALRARALPALSPLREAPADAVLDAACTWAIASLLVGSGLRIGSLPRTCATRTRTIAEDPESLRPIGLGWLVEYALSILPSPPPIQIRRELLARWNAAPLLPARTPERTP